MTIRSSSVSTSTYGRKPAEVLRPRAASIPPSSSTTVSVSYARQQTPGPRQLPSRRLSSAASVSDLRSAALSTRSPMLGQLSRRSVNMSKLPTTRSRSSLRLTVTGDEELGSPYSTKSLSSFQRTSRPLSQADKRRAKYNLLYDIEEEEKASRNEISDLRMRAAKAREYLDRHGQVLNRLRTLQLNGPEPAVSVSLSTSSPQPYPVLSPPTASVRRRSTTAYLSTSRRPSTVATSPAHSLLSRSIISRQSYG